jgi:hypothetical protein
MFERIDLAPNSEWCLEAKQETWLLIVDGSARTVSSDVAKGDAVFAQSDRINIHVGAIGMVGLVAYTGGLVSDLLQHSGLPAEIAARRLQEVHGPTSFHRSNGAPTDGCMETIQ